MRVWRGQPTCFLPLVSFPVVISFPWTFFSVPPSPHLTSHLLFLFNNPQTSPQSAGERRSHKHTIETTNDASTFEVYYATVIIRIKRSNKAPNDKNRHRPNHHGRKRSPTPTGTITKVGKAGTKTQRRAEPDLTWTGLTQAGIYDHKSTQSGGDKSVTAPIHGALRCMWTSDTD